MPSPCCSRYVWIGISEVGVQKEWRGGVRAGVNHRGTAGETGRSWGKLITGDRAPKLSLRLAMIVLRLQHKLRPMRTVRWFYNEDFYVVNFPVDGVRRGEGMNSRYSDHDKLVVYASRQLMTILSVVGGKGPSPIEGEEPERASRSLYQSALTTEELGFFNEVKNFLGSTVNEQLLVQAIKSHGSHMQPHLSGNNVLNDVISLYFDKMESVDKPNKQVRFDEVIPLFNFV
ncbi:unnamed protein product [Onchocerca flexuosa]|uniref:PSD1 domain-containing protein n=1 Tax=Onchocerca flexuosa TaxID=387005 RepID=A0A183I5B2_9BILA|nr:unnamed protein product [Onchocerca flexuosa]